MIAEGIVIADGVSQRADNGQRLAPGVVGILDDLGVGTVNQPDHIALQVIQVAVLRAVEFHNCRAVLRIRMPQHRTNHASMLIVRKFLQGVKGSVLSTL